MPEISVIIPTYQHGDTIAKCLDSIFAQKFNPSVTPLNNGDHGGPDAVDTDPVSGYGASFSHNDRRYDENNIEVIVVNDGSTDETEEILKPYRDKIIYKAIPNSGAPKARNVGFELSKGRFVIFCDADLILKPEMLQTLYDKLKNNPDATYAYAGFRFGLGRFKPLTWSGNRLRRLNFIHTSALIRREDFVGFDESIKKLQDWDMWLTMLEKGKTGVSVNKILFSAKPRKTGMSFWLPRALYSPFFKAIGIRFRSVARYDEAAKIIAQKHDLDLTPNDEIGGKLWLVFLAIFALSAIAFGHPWIGTIVSLVFLALTLAASLNDLIYGVGAILAELIFGSLAGRTLSISFPGFSLPLRLALFAVVGAVWLIRILQGRIRWPQKNIIIGVVIMLAVVGWGMINGLLHGIALRPVFSDANAYFALPLIWFFVSAVKNEHDHAWLKKILKHGVIALSVVTIFALYFFSHKFLNGAGVFAYKWLRDSRIAEITALDNGTYRVFIQSQLFCVVAFIMVAFRDKGNAWKRWAWGILPAAALIISSSRSFALGIGAAAIVWIILIISSTKHFVVIPTIIVGKACPVPRYGAGIHDRTPWTPDFSGVTKENTTIRNVWMTIKKISIFSIAGVIIFLIALKLPFPAARNQRSFEDMLLSKNISQRDAAIASRWALIKALNAKIMEAPLLGSGFGTTVTYMSSDPRIVSTTGGTYTTAAFEWNYHDILVKMGLLGLLAYGYLLYAIFLVIWRSDERERRWLVPAFFALLTLNAVSPFLNHPLGIGYLALLLALAERKRGQPAPIAVSELLKQPSPAHAMAAAPGLAMVSEE